MLGSNVPTVGGLPVGFTYADDWGCKCIQIYVSPSRTWDVPDLTEKEISEFKLAWKNSGVKVVVGHVPYLVNLASPNNELRKKSISRLITEIDRADKLGVSYLVLHPGSNSNKKRGIDLIINGLTTVLNSVKDSRVKILLETMAGQGNTIGTRFEELSYILEKVQSPNIKVCFDTCHVFAAGYDIRGYEGYKLTLKKFDRIIGINNIKVIHLNDSKAELGSRIDRHACIDEGLLGLQVFHSILRDEVFVNVPKILEIPDRDKRSKDNLELLRKLEETIDPIPEKHISQNS